MEIEKPTNQPSQNCHPNLPQSENHYPSNLCYSHSSQSNIQISPVAVIGIQPQIQPQLQQQNHQQKKQQFPALNIVGLGPDSVQTQCPSCRAIIFTKIKHGLKLSVGDCIGWCLYGILCLPCCMVAMCLKSSGNIHHHCPGCDEFIGTYRR